MNSVIGLDRNTVEVLAHNPEWIVLGEHERQSVLNAMSELVKDVQHVGSTSVPSLAAKPIIDLVAALEDVNAVDLIVEQLEKIDYEYRGDSRDDGGHLLIKESSPNIRTVHLHVVEYAGTQWFHYIKFRDALRADEGLRTSYDELKRSLAKRFAGDRKAYTAAKDTFIKDLLGQR